MSFSFLKKQAGFTLYELLIVIGILAVISTITVLIINPTEYLRRARDSERVRDLSNISHALQLGATIASLQNKTVDYNGTYDGGCIGAADGSPDRLFVSVPSEEAAPPGGWEGLTITQAPKASIFNVDGSGWIPVNFNTIFSPQPAPLSVIPVDPINTFSSGYYYSYVCGSFALAAKLESVGLAKVAQSDGGKNPEYYEVGTALSDLPSSFPEGGAGEPSGEAPDIIAFNASQGTLAASVALTVEATGFVSGGSYQIKGWRSPAPLITDAASFFNALSDDFVLPSTNASTNLNTVITDILPEANKTYDFYLLVCNPLNLCTLSSKSTFTTGSNPPNGTITVTHGSPQVVFDYTAPNPGPGTGIGKCLSGDIPDMPPRAVKVGSQVKITRTETKSRMMIGTNFSNLVADCNIVLASTIVPDTVTKTANPNAYDPATFANKEWITALYRKVGETKIHMVVHNEYHDPNPSSDPPCEANIPIPGNPCNYFSATYAYSIDNGLSFQKMSDWQTNHDHFIVGASHLIWPADPGLPAPVFGLPMTSNILQRGSYYYMLVQEKTPAAGDFGVCVARTNNLDDPSSWRFWDGAHYSIRMNSAYDGVTSPNGCAQVSTSNIKNMVSSITYNTYLQKYVNVAGQNDGVPMPNTHCQMYYALSDDLITWTMRQPLYDVPMTGSVCAPTGLGYAYPVFIDHQELNNPSDPNFEIAGKTPFLYYVRLNSGFSSLDRDMVRHMVTFCDSAKETCF